MRPRSGASHDPGEGHLGFGESLELNHQVVRVSSHLESRRCRDVIQLLEVKVVQQWAEHRTLGRTTLRLPVFLAVYNLGLEKLPFKT